MFTVWDLSNAWGYHDVVHSMIHAYMRSVKDRAAVGFIPRQASHIIRRACNSGIRIKELAKEQGMLTFGQTFFNNHRCLSRNRLL